MQEHNMVKNLNWYQEQTPPHRGLLGLSVSLALPYPGHPAEHNFFPIPPRAPSRRYSKPLMLQKEVDIKSVSLLIYLTV